MRRPFIDPFGAELPTTGAALASMTREEYLAAVATLHEYAYGETLHAQPMRDVATQRAQLHATLALTAPSPSPNATTQR